MCFFLLDLQHEIFVPAFRLFSFLRCSGGSGSSSSSSSGGSVGGSSSSGDGGGSSFSLFKFTKKHDKNHATDNKAHKQAPTMYTPKHPYDLNPRK